MLQRLVGWAEFAALLSIADGGRDALEGCQDQLSPIAHPTCSLSLLC